MVGLGDRRPNSARGRRPLSVGQQPKPWEAGRRPEPPAGPARWRADLESWALKQQQPQHSTRVRSTSPGPGAKDQKRDHPQLLDSKPSQQHSDVLPGPSILSRPSSEERPRSSTPKRVSFSDTLEGPPAAGSAVSLLRHARSQAVDDASLESSQKGADEILVPASSEDPVLGGTSSSEDIWMDAKLHVAKNPPSQACSASLVVGAVENESLLKEFGNALESSAVSGNELQAETPRATAFSEPALKEVNAKMDAAMRAQAVEHEWLRQKCAVKQFEVSSGAQSGAAETPSHQQSQHVQGLLDASKKRESQLQKALEDALEQIASLKGLKSLLDASEKRELDAKKGAEDAIAQINSVNEATTRLHDMRVDELLDSQAQLRIQLEKAKQAAAGEVAAANVRIAGLEAEVRQLSQKTQEPEDPQAKAASEFKDEGARHQEAAEMQELKEKHLIAVSEATAAKARVASLEIDLSLLNGKLSEPKESQAKVLEVEKELKEEKERHRVTEAEAAAAKAHVAMLQAEVSQLSAKLQEVSSSQAQQRQVARELKEEKERHEVAVSEVDGAKKRVASLDAEVRELRAKLQELQEQSARHKAEVAEANAAKERIASLESECKNELRVEKEKHLEAVSEATAAKASTASLQIEVGQLGGDLQELREQHKDLQEKCKKLLAVEAEAIAAKASAASFEVEVSQLKRTLQGLSEESRNLEELEKDLSSHKEASAADKRRFQDLENEFSSHKEASAEEKRKLQERLAQSLSSEAALSVQVNELESAHKKVVEENENAEKQMKVALCWARLAELVWARSWCRDAGSAIRERFFTLNRVSLLTGAVFFSAKGVCDPTLTHIDTLLDKPDAGEVTGEDRSKTGNDVIKSDNAGCEGVFAGFAGTASAERASTLVKSHGNSDESDEQYLSTGDAAAEPVGATKSDGDQSSVTAAEPQSFQARFSDLQDAVNEALKAVAAADASTQSRSPGGQSED